MLVLLAFSACTDDSDTPTPETPAYSYFAKGADVSWTTEMEKANMLFYNAAGKATESMALMQELGMNAIRLRVWVNPADGWSNKSDFLVKAMRANYLGMRLMVDFHYSDIWADPGSQTKPASWANLTFSELEAAVSAHTTEVLALLKSHNITPEWVQVGNETSNGMLWDDGNATTNIAQYTALNNAGYDAVKAVYPNAKVIVHLHNGFNNNLYRWMFDRLKANGGKWDVIGMSLYPTVENWQELNNQCVANMNDMVARYGKEVMICEVGMPWDEAETSYLFLNDIMTRAKAIANEKCLGVFYWEPQAYNNWKGYSLGAFDNAGKPTKALEAFK